VVILAGIFELPGAGGLFEPLTEVSHGGGLPNVGRIKKMAVMQYRPLGGGPDDLAPLGIALTRRRLPVALLC
jgi:hypothetical protein